MFDCWEEEDGCSEGEEVKEVSGPVGLGQAGAAVPTRRICRINERLCGSGARSKGEMIK